jgi:hypothetical protein
VQFCDNLEAHANVGSTIVIFVCGYNNRQLKEWSERRPSVTFLDDSGRKFLLPLPLSPVDVGQNTGMSIARMTRTAAGWIVEPTVNAATSTTTSMPPDRAFATDLQKMCSTPAVLSHSVVPSVSSSVESAASLTSVLPQPPTEERKAATTLMVFQQEGSPDLGIQECDVEKFSVNGSLPFAGMVTMSFASLLCESPQSSLPHIHVLAANCGEVNVETSHVPHVGLGYNGIFVCFKDINKGDVIEGTNLMQMMTALGPRGVLVMAFYSKDTACIQHYRYVMGYVRDPMILTGEDGSSTKIPIRGDKFELETMAAVYAHEVEFAEASNSSKGSIDNSVRAGFQNVGEDVPCPVDLQPIITSLTSVDAIADITFDKKLVLVRLLAEFNAYRSNKGPVLIEAAHAIGQKMLSQVTSQISELAASCRERNKLVGDLLKSVSGVIMYDDDKTKLDEFVVFAKELAEAVPDCKEHLVEELAKEAAAVDGSDIKAVSSFLQSASGRLANRKKISGNIVTIAIKSLMKPVNEKLQEVLHPLQFWAQRCPRWAQQYPKIALPDLRGLVRTAEGKISHGKAVEMTVEDFLMLTADTTMLKVTADVGGLVTRAHSGQLEIDLGLLSPEELLTVAYEEAQQLMSPNDIAKTTELVVLLFEVGISY